MEQVKRLKCTYCEENIVPSSSWSYEEMGCDGEGIVTIYLCHNKLCTVDEIYIYQRTKNEIYSTIK